MWNAGIDHVENFIMGPLFIEFLDEAGRNVYNLDNCFILKTARFDLEVTRILRASIVNRNQFKHLFVKVSFHDTIQRVLVIFVLCQNVLFFFIRSDIYLCE